MPAVRAPCTQHNADLGSALCFLVLSISLAAPDSSVLLIGRGPCAAFGNSDGDKEMLEYTKAGEGGCLSLLSIG